MGMWLRIPLEHPEAMDPERRRRGSTADSSRTDNGDTVGGPIDGAGDEAAVKSDGEEPVGGIGPEAEVEDPWETWNTVRVLCEHKSW